MPALSLLLIFQLVVHAPFYVKYHLPLAHLGLSCSLLSLHSMALFSAAEARWIPQVQAFGLRTFAHLISHRICAEASPLAH
eukprot:scaffold4844_cov90-Skeletonema_dohrnii-CCMP3373.AAC.2